VLSPGERSDEVLSALRSTTSFRLSRLRGGIGTACRFTGSSSMDRPPAQFCLAPEDTLPRPWLPDYSAARASVRVLPQQADTEGTCDDN
jgi:hypothetical protein